MKLNEIKDNEGARKSRKRVARGIGSGSGKTAGRGQKGQKSRSGVAVNGFEGGQMPLIRRVPKRGFTNIFAKEYSIVNVKDLERFEDGTVVNAELLLKVGVLSKVENYGLKVLGNGTLTKKLTVQAKKFTKSAAEIIEKAGGKAEVL